MKRARRFSAWGLLLVATAAHCNGLVPPWASPDDSAEDLARRDPAPEPSWAGAGSYLLSLFDDAQALCHPAPGVTTFWSTSDNALAARALAYLPVPTAPTGHTYSEAIVARLQTFKACGCNDQREHDALTDHHFDPVVNPGAQLPLQPHTSCSRAARLVPTAASSCTAAGASCSGAGFDLRYEDYPESGWVGDTCAPSKCTVTTVAGWDEEEAGHGDAELIALQLLSYKNRGLETAALWRNLVGKWDGKGVRDRPSQGEGKYTTDKLALLKLCARVLAKPLPDGVDHQLAAAQNARGGFRTSYDLSGNFTLDQLGSARTTALVVLAYRKPAQDF